MPLDRPGGGTGPAEATPSGGWRNPRTDPEPPDAGKRISEASSSAMRLHSPQAGGSCRGAIAPKPRLRSWWRAPSRTFPSRQADARDDEREDAQDERAVPDEGERIHGIDGRWEDDDRPGHSDPRVPDLVRMELAEVREGSLGVERP